MAIEVVPFDVKNRKQLKAFIDLPWKLYRGEEHWIPPLKIAVKELLGPKHPFYQTADVQGWLAYKDGEVVGRIFAIVNHEHNRIHQEKCGHFGLYESTDDQEVAHALMSKAEQWLADKGMEKMIGPMNPSTNYECGMLVEGFDQDPQVMTPYTLPYYNDLMANEGLEKAKDLLSYHVPTDIKYPEKIMRIADRALKGSRVSFRHLNKKNWDAEVKAIREIYNKAWEDNWGYVPQTEEEFAHTAKELKMVADERLILFAQVDGKDAGFIAAIPDFNQVFKQIPSGKLFPTGIFKLLRPKKYISRVKVIIMGVLPEYRLKGLAALLYKQIQIEVLKAGHVEAELGWVLEDNAKMNRPLEVMGAEVVKKHRLYQKQLSQ